MNFLDYFLSTLYLIQFLLALFIFHPIQWLCFNLFGFRAHQKSVHWLNASLLYGSLLTGARLKFIQKTTLPTDKPIIFVANHQSMFDIIGIIWFLRQYYPVFVSKIELSKGVPSISYNLRKSGAALIDRKDSKQSITEIIRLGKLIQNQNIAAVIFPEGTRARTNNLKEFAVGGVATLMKKAPDALVVPIAVSGTGKFNPKSFFPVKSFTKLTWTVLPAISRTNKTAEEIVLEARAAIAAENATLI